MTVFQNNTLSTDSLKGKLAYFLFNNFEYTDISKPAAITANPISDTDFCMKMAESSLAEEWENEDDDYWESFM